MIYKNLHINIIIRTLLIVVVSIIFAFSILTTNYIFTISLLVIILMIQVWEFIHYMNKANQKLGHFLSQFKTPNQNSKHPKPSQSEKQGLEHLFNTINEIILDKSIKAESQFHYLQSVVDNTQSGILSFNKENGKIEFINKTASNYFGTKRLSSLDYLKDKYPHIWKTITEIKAGEQKVESLNSQHGLVQISIKCSIMKFKDRTVQIISMHNIQAELEENELESWRKLVRVLTHEISNSIAPITSITNSLIKLLDSDESTTENLLSDIRLDSINGLETIQNRSLALKSFIEKFRNLTRIPQLKTEVFRLRSILEQCYILFEQELFEKNIQLKISCIDDEITAIGDQHLLEQVMINLLKNAIQACDKKPSEIIISASKKKNGKNYITVSDNGSGIDHEQLSQIFIPFYTSKEEGSGIGLSLCRQIMRLHNGTIIAESKKGEGTTFILKF